MVYRIYCDDCPTSYVTETGRKLKERAEDRKTEAGSLADVNSSATAEYVWTTGHSMNWSNGRSYIAQQTIHQARLLLEVTEQR